MKTHETCQQYVARRLSEGWRILGQEGFEVTLQSPEGIIRPVDLRNDIETLRPNAVGDECNIDGQVGCDACGVGDGHYPCIDAIDDATYIGTYGDTYLRDLFNLPAHSEGSGTINSVTVYARCYADAEPERASLKIACQTGGTPYEGNEETLTTSWANYSKQWTTNPGGGNWSWDDIDSLQIGVVLRDSFNPNKENYASYCSQIYVEVDYTPAGLENKSANMAAKTIAGKLI